MLIDPDTPQVFHWSRLPDGTWRHALIEGLDHLVELPEIPCVLDFTTLYAGLTFSPRPRLVHNDETEADMQSEESR